MTFEDNLFGNFDDSLTEKLVYDPLMQQFSFVSNRIEIIFAGKVHVSVGFVDLGYLIWSDISGDTNVATMQWIGYEASPFCTAKTIVFAEMLKNGS